MTSGKVELLIDIFSLHKHLDCITRLYVWERNCSLHVEKNILHLNDANDNLIGTTAFSFINNMCLTVIALYVSFLRHNGPVNGPYISDRSLLSISLFQHHERGTLAVAQLRLTILLK